MRHRQSNRKLNRTTSHRLAMFRNMTMSLIRHERTGAFAHARSRRRLGARILAAAHSKSFVWHVAC